MNQALPFSSGIGFIIAFQKSPSIMPSTWIVPKRPKAPKNLKTSQNLSKCNISYKFNMFVSNPTSIWWNVSWILLTYWTSPSQNVIPKRPVDRAGSPTRALLTAATWPRALLTFPPRDREELENKKITCEIRCGKPARTGSLKVLPGKSLIWMFSNRGNCD